MPNALLTQDNGNAVSVPADAITAIISLALDVADPAHPEARCLAHTAHRGAAHTYWLRSSGRETAHLVELAREGKRALRMSKKGPLPVSLEVGEDASYFQDGAVFGYEVVGVGDDARYLATYRRHDGPVFDIAVNHSDSNRKILNQVTDTKGDD